MRKIDPRHVHARSDHPSQHLWRLRRWSDGADNLGFVRWQCQEPSPPYSENEMDGYVTDPTPQFPDHDNGAGLSKWTWIQVVPTTRNFILYEH